MLSRGSALNRIRNTLTPNTWRIYKEFGTDHKSTTGDKPWEEDTMLATGHPKEKPDRTADIIISAPITRLISKAILTRHSATSCIYYWKFTVQKVRMKIVQFILLNIIFCSAEIFVMYYNENILKHLKDLNK